LVAPVQDLALTPDTQEPGRFRLRAEVPFLGPGPRPVVVIHFSVEATALAPDQIEALTAEAREVRAGFALVLPAGVPRDPETGGIEVVPPEPVDPGALVIGFEVLNPTGDAFVAQLLAITTLLAVIHSTVRPGRQKVHNMNKPKVWIHVNYGGGARLIGSDGKGFDVFPGQDAGPARGPVVTVRGLGGSTTGYYLY
ncbi:MAG: hypothetical protein QOK35_1309, partial [Pseudonocardiales bacterium]|nr:hypothetical protein [Pseudonocardiales bacterium]